LAPSSVVFTLSTFVNGDITTVGTGGVLFMANCDAQDITLNEAVSQISNSSTQDIFCNQTNLRMQNTSSGDITATNNTTIVDLNGVMESLIVDSTSQANILGSYYNSITGPGEIDRSIQNMTLPVVSGPTIGLTAVIDPPYIDNNFNVVLTQNNNTALSLAPSVYSLLNNGFTYNAPDGASYNIVITKTASPLVFSDPSPPTISLPSAPRLRIFE
jgi:hypothetical protein